MNSIKRAIIIAAGEGVRLRPYTNSTPKTLLKISSYTIFDRLVNALCNNGIEEIVVVIGHSKIKLLEHIDNITKNIGKDLEFRFVYNNKLDIGNIYSLWLARDYMDKDFILCNSDVIFHPYILSILKTTNKISMAIDDMKELTEEDMKVLINKDNVIKDISKTLEISKADGEYIGLMKVDADLSHLILEKTKLLLDGKRFPLYYEDALRLIANERDDILACKIGGLPWIEIDTKEDLEHAKHIAGEIDKLYDM